MATEDEIIDQQLVNIQGGIDKVSQDDQASSDILQQNSATQLEQDKIKTEESLTMAQQEETANLIDVNVGNEGGQGGATQAKIEIPAATTDQPTEGPSTAVDSPQTTTDGDPATAGPAGDTATGTPDTTDGTQGDPAAATVSQTTRETLEQSKDNPLDTLGERGLTQEVVKLEIGDDEIVADPTVFNVAAKVDPALDLDNLAQAKVPGLGEAEQAEAAAAVIAKDYELSLLDPKEMGQNLARLREEEPMQAASMTTEMTALLDGMENGEIPLWAKPAVTKVEQQLAARGIGASSIGRDALFNAIIQSAMPIAQQNASFKQDANKVNYNAKIQAIFSDVAAENAAKNFNASSINQKNQFMTGLQANLDSQTASRKDAISTFNAGEKNKFTIVGAQLQAAASQFNAAQANAAAQFQDGQDQNRALHNSTQAAAIEQSNVNWRRKTNTINNALENQVNQVNAQNAFNLSNQATSFLWGEIQDEAKWANDADAAAKTHKNNLEVAVMANEFTGAKAKGGWIANATSAWNLLDKMFDD